MATPSMKQRMMAMASGVVLLAGAGIVGIAGPASAAERAPSCVSVYTSSNGDVHVANNCKTSKRIKIVMAWGPDLSCRSWAAGSSGRYSDPTGRLDRVDLC